MTTVSPTAAEAADVLALPLPHLDQWPYAHLLQAVALQVAPQGGYSVELALRLDQLLTLKVARLMASPQATADDRQALAALIGALNRESYRDSLDVPPLRFATRWHTLVDMLETASRLQQHQAQAVARAQAGLHAAHRPEPALWAAIARRVVHAGASGLAMSEAADEITRHHGQARSKGSVSQTLSAMCAAGWLASVADGRQKRLYAGPALPAHVAAAEQAVQAAAAAPQPQGHAASERALKLARDTVCLNQGLLLSYYDEAHQLHLRLRDTLAELTASAGKVRRPPPEGLEKLRTLKCALDGYLFNFFNWVMQENFEILPRHFEGRSDLPPRLCLKGSWQAGEDSDLIVPVIRDGGAAPYDGPQALPGRNTGFEAVQATGQAFLAHDLAVLAMAGGYHNPRLMPEAVAQLAAEVGPGRAQDITWQRWQSCWAPTAGQPASARACYRSTLIVPLTLRNNMLAPALRERLRNDVPELKSNETWERAILGYLCFDHPLPGYFREEDRHLGYIVADALTLYVMGSLSVTTLSKTYQKVRELLQGTHEHCTTEVSDKTWDSLVRVLSTDAKTEGNVSVRSAVVAPAPEWRSLAASEA